ncbi:tRNA uridine-5-carboxymethylaminomethyl(34) synthesis GTPase MnmE [Acidihalobacter ferrooxydans]|uniref:tRNA modification GTPase MnmE n=1 Tax=Acidihalobacter ferrooxydans TaxID=1765967 RepID=A0A1P8UKW8_9GAMM|nr:tRNA uridine-5-carboxymethylaminomethyl(34) synthesis GTPase MnmE [Acidihalobacter ferrooxydans]APZ44432.1 tRNA uridine-5-carboxymethylaminomethyl(34) synthesis GTPase MnmE [Acidihalobacter ferrooxydans]
MVPKDTIAAIATAPGRGAVGIIRISGTEAISIAERLTRELPPPRRAAVRELLADDGAVLDEAVVLVFPGPSSFTGENVVELQGHGGPAVLELLLERVVELGARLARPGEFSERAFLNGRMDLVQAEAVADLIAASSRRAAQSAVRSLRGEFSRRIEALVIRLTNLRARLEADFDFSDDDIDPYAEEGLRADLAQLTVGLDAVLDTARQGERMSRGYTIVLAGAPNVGKSSLLNCLADSDIAIVTAIPGTTRDLLRAQVEIDGLAVDILDTAGLRDSDDPIEQEGVRRALNAIAQADLLIRVYDDDVTASRHDELKAFSVREDMPVLEVFNKVDLSGGVSGARGAMQYGVSALQGQGISALRAALVQALGIDTESETPLLARARHVAALEAAHLRLSAARELQSTGEGAELIAEELRGAQNLLGEITGQVTSEDLLGVIFSTFCIGK